MNSRVGRRKKFPSGNQVCKARFPLNTNLRKCHFNGNRVLETRFPLGNFPPHQSWTLGMAGGKNCPVEIEFLKLDFHQKFTKMPLEWKLIFRNSISTGKFLLSHFPLNSLELSGWEDKKMPSLMSRVLSLKKIGLCISLWLTNCNG